MLKIIGTMAYGLNAPIKSVQYPAQVPVLNAQDPPVPNAEGSVPNTQDPVPNTQDPVPNTQDPVPNTQDPVPNTQDPVPNTQDPVPNTQDPVPNTQDPVPNAEDPVPNAPDAPGDVPWSSPSSLAVRFSIAAGELRSEQRLAALDPLLSYCKEVGLGLLLADVRPNRRPGAWFPILECNPVIAAPGLSEPPDVELDTPLQAGYTVTLLGPARLGSTAAIFECLDEFSELPILCSSITSLADMALISFAIGLAEYQNDEELRSTIPYRAWEDNAMP